MMTQTSAGVRCGNCQDRHPTPEDVRACYAERYAGQAYQRDEIEAERRNEEVLAHGTPERAEQARANEATLDAETYVPHPGHCPECGSNPGWSHDAGCSIADRKGEAMVPASDLDSLVTWLREATWNEFARSLVAFYDHKGHLTEKQIEAGKRLREGATTEQHAFSVPEGRYAIVEGDVVKFYVVERPTEGKWAGRIFLNAQAGDDLHPIKSYDTKHRVLTAIARDSREAALRYGHELGVCGRCGRTLTDEASRAAGIGPVCANKAGW